MEHPNDRSEKPGKHLAAVCGLYCEACRWFIATAEDPERLQRLAAEAHYSREESRCYGCRSDKRLAYCAGCKMYACAAGRGIDFCGECDRYPCADLQQFQAEKPHRLELWANLARIKAVGYEQWLAEIRGRYTCPRCRTINSCYDLQCRSCGGDPSCAFVAEHREAIERSGRR